MLQDSGHNNRVNGSSTVNEDILQHVKLMAHLVKPQYSIEK